MLVTLAAWVHDIDPYAIRLWEDGPIRWYGLSYLVGFLVGYLLVRRVVTVGAPDNNPLKREQVGDFIILVAMGIVIGGRVGYCLFYDPSLFVEFSGSFPFWGVLAINQGGMASHGGILGGVIAVTIFARRRQHDLLYLLDLFAFGAPLGLFFGRVANFINGELFGREAPAGLPWAVKFPQELYDDPALAHTALQATQTSSIPRLINAIQAGDEQVRAAVAPLLTARHPSQLYAAVTEGLVVLAVLLWVWRGPRRPGVVGAWFCIAYAVMRIFNEFFRRPDAHLMDRAEFAALGITRGQWLSVILLGVGLAILWLSRRREARPMGGWRRGPWTAETTPEAADPPR